MATIASIAQRVLDETDYTADDMTLTKLELCIDTCIDYVNLETGASIAYLSGTADTKSLTCDRKYMPVIKLLAALMIRASQDRGPEPELEGVSMRTVVADPQYKLFMQIIERSLKQCRTAYTQRV